MNKKGYVQLAGLVAIAFFLAVLYTLNYQLPSENFVYLNSDGFNLEEITIAKGEYINIYNNDTITRRIFMEGIESPEIQPNHFIRYRLTGRGVIYAEIRDRPSINAIIRITIE